MQLTAALGFTRLDPRKIGGFTVGKIKVTKQEGGFTHMFDEYKRTIYLLKSKSVKESKYPNQTRGGKNIYG